MKPKKPLLSEATASFAETDTEEEAGTPDALSSAAMEPEPAGAEGREAFEGEAPLGFADLLLRGFLLFFLDEEVFFDSELFRGLEVFDLCISVSFATMRRCLHVYAHGL